MYLSSVLQIDRIWKFGNTFLGGKTKKLDEVYLISGLWVDRV